MFELIRCLHDANGELTGGLAEVHFGEDALSEPGEHVTVLVTGTDGEYSAESFSTAGKRIQFCGHGALAAAWLVFNRTETNRDELMFSNADRHWRAQRVGPDKVTLLYKQPELAAVPVPAFAEAAFGMVPDAAAEIGGNSDYLVLEFTHAETVRTLHVDPDRITAATSRAVIATAFANDGFVYRYFAPQYGEPEDAATGSAAVQLAAYWSPRSGSNPMTARQLSVSGAVAQVICHSDKVELTARVGYG